ncbi:MAG TPA: histidine kinase [Steroidobacteraceae bacterium]|nr:histidine kinase [Steroidobacteraceae bacterium]
MENAIATTFLRKDRPDLHHSHEGHSLSRVALIVAAWTLLALIRTPSALLVTGSPANAAIYWEWKFLEVLASLVPWMLVTPLILFVADRLPLKKGSLWRWLMLQLFLGIGITATASGAGVLLMRPLFDSISGSEFSWWMRQTTISSFYAVTSYIAVLGIGYSMAYFERDKQRERFLVEARLRSLTAQLNPHFLFNTLNAISSLAYENPVLADESLCRLSEILRKSLSGLPARISLQDEIALVRQYADLHVMLMPDRLRIEFDIDAPARAAVVPSMFLQPLIENAITHGVARLERGGKIVIKAQASKTHLCITVTNDGPVRHAGCVVTRGLGLTNVCERLQVLYGDEQTIRLKYRAEGGLEAYITLPFEPQQVTATP